MNNPYVIDFDGLDGLYELTPSISIEKTNDPITLSRDRNSDDQIVPYKRSSSFLLGFSLLALSGLIFYVGGEFLHKDAPKIEPLVELKDTNKEKETKLLAVKEEKQKILDEINDIKEKLAKGKKINPSKLPGTTFSNNKIDRNIQEEFSSETPILNTDSLIPDDLKKYSEIAQLNKEGINKKTPASLAKDKERTFDTLVLNEAYLDETELEPKPVDRVKKGVEFKNVDSAVATRVKNEEQENSKPNLKPSDLATVSMSNIATTHDTLNSNIINSNEISSYILRFDFNKTAILSLSTPKEATLKSFLQRCPDDIQVVGHTCNLGSVADNQAIGRIRAEEVKDLLIKIGFSAERIQVLSGGQNEPVASNNTLAGRALNRRVVVDCFSQSENNKKRK